MMTHSLVLYRAMADQKAELVNFVKKLDRDEVILAIGDGANDVDMLRAADIGVAVKPNDVKSIAFAAMYADISVP